MFLSLMSISLLLAGTPDQTAPTLEGSWRRCQILKYAPYEVPGLPSPGIKAVQLVMHFSGGKGAYDATFFQDAACTDPLTDADKDAFKAEMDAYFKSQGGEGLPPDEAQDIDQNLRPYHEAFGYHAADGALDIVQADGTIFYTAYRFEGAQLLIAEGCSEDDIDAGADPSCKELGHTPEKRVTNFDVQPYSALSR